MDDETRILASGSRRSQANGGSACLVHIYPTGPAMGMRYPLGKNPVTLGREQDCFVTIDDDSVSRNHATIEPDGDGFNVSDRQSTNGTLVNGVRVSSQKLKDGDYLHVGNCIFRFLAGGNIEAAYHEEIYRLTIIDGLTGIHNKRYFHEFLSRELACAVRYRRPLALVMLDLDRFKEINDSMGHLAGDISLRELAACIKPIIRKEDLFARYGGEEFAVVMPETTREGALQFGDRLRELVENHPFHYEEYNFHLTISLGVAAATGDEWMTTSELIGLADEKLYEAKSQGRNRVMA